MKHNSTRARPRLAFARCRNRTVRITRHFFDVFDPAKTQRRPIVIYRHHAHRLKARSPQYRPARVAIELALVFFRRAFWISHPKHGIARTGVRQSGASRIELALGNHKSNGKCAGSSDRALNANALKRRQLGFKGARRIEYVDGGLRA